MLPELLSIMMVEAVLPPDPLVWVQGSRPKARKLATRVNVDLASLPGPPGFLGGHLIQVYGCSISGADIAAWPDSVGILCKITAVLGSSHGPVGSEDMGHFGVSFLEILIISSNGRDIGCSVKR